MDAARQALVQAGAALASQVVAFENRMATITENANVRAVRPIVRGSDEVARGALDAQTRAMEEAARTLFRTEIGPTLQRLVMPLQRLAERGARPGERWLAHAATAAVASALASALAGQ